LVATLRFKPEWNRARLLFKVAVPINTVLSERCSDANLV